MHSKFLLISIVCGALGPALSAAPVSGEAVYQKRCASCHDSGNARVPSREALKKVPVTRIERSLDFGAMSNVASFLRRDEREAVAAYLGVAANNPAPPAKAFCSDRGVAITGRSRSEWNGWSPGAVVAGGMVFVNSGYPSGAMPGNVLLAFAPDE
jgi:cytochrome c553